MPDVEIVTDKDRQTVILNGCLDGLTAPEFGEKMKDKLDDITMLILDLKDLTYISSAGLREILTLQQVMEEQGAVAYALFPDNLACPDAGMDHYTPDNCLGKFKRLDDRDHGDNIHIRIAA